MTERKMATIRRIDEIRPIEGADAIEAAVVGGWVIVTKRGEFKAGDLAVYLEIDSWVPHEIAPFLSKGQEPREYNGVKGERLRTVKLRGQISQGLLLPINETILTEWEVAHYVWSSEEGNFAPKFVGGEDLTEILGIQKWEAPIPAQLAGDVEGNFPTVIPKTDQERIQNLTEELRTWQSNSAFTWEVTEKLDGSSMTVFVHGDREGVCSRNWALKETAGNTLWAVARREQLIEKIRQTGRNLALQGELIGEGIQGNAYSIKGQDFRLFDIYDIDRGEYLGPLERRMFAETHGIKHVPVFATEMVIEEWVTGLLTMADGVSALNPKTNREGLVFKCNEADGPSFKVISNKWLMKNGG
jgi:RNA ligase (TIGR02306 family)